MQNKFPKCTVDVLILYKKGFVIIHRKYPPLGWALPGGYVEYGESLEDAAIREAKEETNLTVKLLMQFHTYSDPKRDPIAHKISTLFIGKGAGTLRAGDDATGAKIVSLNICSKLLFDHNTMVEDYVKYYTTGKRRIL